MANEKLKTKMINGVLHVKVGKNLYETLEHYEKSKIRFAEWEKKRDEEVRVRNTRVEFKDWALLPVGKMPLMDAIEAFATRTKEQEHNKRFFSLYAEPYAEKRRQHQAEEYHITDIMNPRMSRKKLCKIAKRVEEQNAGKEVREFVDPKHLSDDADFYDVKEEGIDLILPSPNNTDPDEKIWKRYEKYSGRFITSEHSILKCLKKYINPNLKRGTSKEKMRYLQKLMTPFPPTFTNEELTNERIKQYDRDAMEAVDVIDALLQQKNG